MSDFFLDQDEAAREEGINEVVRLLQNPNDLYKVHEIKKDFENRRYVAKTSLSSMVLSQVEATEAGINLLEKSYRHVKKLQHALAKIERLSAESSALIENHARIKLLSVSHSNLQKVLTEIEDIVDLPFRAELCEKMLKDDLSNLIPAFENLTELTRTSENALLEWQKSVKGREEVTELTIYLTPVAQAMERLEDRVFDLLDDFLALAVDKPDVLVDCLKIIEIQEALDETYSRAPRQPGELPYRRKEYRSSFFFNLSQRAEDKFGELIRLSDSYGLPNKNITYDQNGDLVTKVDYDRQGRILKLSRVTTPATGGGPREETVTDLDILSETQIIEEKIFDEQRFFDDFVDQLASLQTDLATCYDYAQTCFPPSYNIFEKLFQMYHVNFAIAVDSVGQRAKEFTTRGALMVMDWVNKYMDTLRNLGVEEAMVKLPISPHANPDDLPGMVKLMDSYVSKMMDTVSTWYRNILSIDVKTKPKTMANGTLFTPGALDFFRILNEQISVIKRINSHVDVMLKTAQCSLRIMINFQDSLQDILKSQSLSLEAYAAFLNNALTCYDQSLSFAEDVQKQLPKGYQDQLDVEVACRGFLEVAKLAARKACEQVYNDPGMSSQLKGIFTSRDWFDGKSMAIVVATLKDYFDDFKVWINASFLKRTAEAALDELVVRVVTMFFMSMPQRSGTLLSRMRQDEDTIRQYFEAYLKPERLQRSLDAISALSELLTADSAESFTFAVSELLSRAELGYSGHVTLESLVRLLTQSRPELNKKQVTEFSARCRELWKQKGIASKAGMTANREMDGEDATESRGLFSSWRRKPAAEIPAAAAPAADAKQDGKAPEKPITTSVKLKIDYPAGSPTELAAKDAKDSKEPGKANSGSAGSKDAAKDSKESTGKQGGFFQFGRKAAAADPVSVSAPAAAKKDGAPEATGKDAATTAAKSGAKDEKGDGVKSRDKTSSSSSSNSRAAEERKEGSEDEEYEESGSSGDEGDNREDVERGRRKPSPPAKAARGRGAKGSNGESSGKGAPAGARTEKVTGGGPKSSAASSDGNTGVASVQPASKGGLFSGWFGGPDKSSSAKPAGKGADASKAAPGKLEKLDKKAPEPDLGRLSRQPGRQEERKSSASEEESGDDSGSDSPPPPPRRGRDSSSSKKK